MMYVRTPQVFAVMILFLYTGMDVGVMFVYEVVLRHAADYVYPLSPDQFAEALYVANLFEVLDLRAVLARAASQCLRFDNVRIVGSTRQWYKPSWPRTCIWPSLVFRCVYLLAGG